MDKEEYTIKLEPRSKTRINVGEYDIETSTPRYNYSVLIPEHGESNVVVEPKLLKFYNFTYEKVYAIENKTDWPAFISIYKDGELIPNDFA
jgi:hypothetical protein